VLLLLQLLLLLLLLLDADKLDATAAILLCSHHWFAAYRSRRCSATGTCSCTQAVLWLACMQPLVLACRRTINASSCSHVCLAPLAAHAAAHAATIQCPAECDLADQPCQCCAGCPMLFAYFVPGSSNSRC
jgi:hypothetical protein